MDINQSNNSSVASTAVNMPVNQKEIPREHAKLDSSLNTLLVRLSHLEDTLNTVLRPKDLSVEEKEIHEVPPFTNIGQFARDVTFSVQEATKMVDGMINRIEL